MKTNAKAKKKPTDEVVFLGVYPLGFTNIRCYYNPSLSGASFDGYPDDEGTPKIVIGDSEYWGKMLAYVMHEALELALCDIRCRFRPTNDRGQDAGNYTFMFTHDQFSHVVACTGDMMHSLIPALREAWQKQNP